MIFWLKNNFIMLFINIILVCLIYLLIKSNVLLSDRYDSLKSENLKLYGELNNTALRYEQAIDREQKLATERGLLIDDLRKKGKSSNCYNAFVDDNIRNKLFSKSKK